MAAPPFAFAFAVVLSLTAVLFFLPSSIMAISGCNGPCKTLDDCAGVLICINGRCADDPDVGSHICSSTPPPPPPRTPPPPPPRTPPPPPPPTPSPPPPSTSSCTSSGTLTCSGVTYPTYTCSPPVSSSTSALLTLNDFSEGGDGGAPSECDENYHPNSELVVALSTGWYASGSRCLKNIRITASNGKSTLAKVVDECDSRAGCDADHAYQPPCRNNIVDGSSAVWNALGLDQNLGVVPVTWTMA